MDLQAFLEELDADEARNERLHDLPSLIEAARKKGLVMGGDTTSRKLSNVEARGILTALEARRQKASAPRPQRLEKALPIDMSKGELVANLAGVVTKWMDVSPEMAKVWLLNNFNNRKVSMDLVRAYARDMMNMKWIPNHQGIAFNNKHELIDGQHRLMAIELSGETVRTLVTWGLPSKVQGTRMTGMDTVDRGKTRTVADQLKIQHRIDAGSILAAVCSRLAGICSPERTRRLSVGEVLDIHEIFQNPVDWVLERRPKAHGFKQAGVLAGFAFAIAADGIESDTAGMFTHLTTGQTEEGTPMRLLYQFLTSEAAILLTRGNDRALAELVLQAIWLQKRGRGVTILEHGIDGLAAYREAQPEAVGRVAGMFLLPKCEGMERITKTAA